MEISKLLPTLLPKAVKWAEAEARLALALGRKLTVFEASMALKAGVAAPQHIRISSVREMPIPENSLLRMAAEQTGLLGPGAQGLTLGYAVIVREGFEAPYLLAHEFRHVCQYEQAGSIAAFIPVYLQQILEFGYEQAPLEVDARSFERLAERFPYSE